jgi:hypothetical protein
LDEYGEKSLVEDAKLGNALKHEHSVSTAEGKEIVGNQKWVKKEEGEEQENIMVKNNNKQMDPPPRRPNKRRTRTEKEAENDRGTQENNTEMPKSPPRQKRVAGVHSSMSIAA